MGLGPQQRGVGGGQEESGISVSRKGFFHLVNSPALLLVQDM